MKCLRHFRKEEEEEKRRRRKKYFPIGLHLFAWQVHAKNTHKQRKRIKKERERENMH